MVLMEDDQKLWIEWPIFNVLHNTASLQLMEESDLEIQNAQQSII